MVNLGIFALLGILEFLFLLIVLIVVLFLQWRSAKRAVAELKARLAELRTQLASRQVEPRNVSADASESAHAYADFLREQLDQSSVLLGEDAAAAAQGALDAADSESDDDIERQMLAARHQFLQLELDVQAAGEARDVDAQRKQIVAGMRALLEGLQLEEDAEDTKGAEDAEAESADAPRKQRSEEDKLHDQITYLRSVIDNQHTVMKELRGLIEEHGGDSQELQAALDKLSLAEHQSANLKKRLKDIERGKLTHLEVGGAAAKKAAELGNSSPDADMLKDLVSNQQRTIQNLQQMLQKIAPDSEKAKEFTVAMDKIQRTNNELNSCVMILEDENSSLRDEIDELQQRISNLEAQAVAGDMAVAGPVQAVEAASDSDAAQDAAADTESVPAHELPAQADAVVAATAAEPDEAAVDDIDALLDAAAEPVSVAEASHAEVGQESTLPDEASEAPLRVPSLTAGEAEQDDIDALLEAAAKPAPKAEETAEKSEEHSGEPSEASPANIKSLTEGESDQSDIDALLNDLFGEESSDKGSKAG